MKCKVWAAGAVLASVFAGTGCVSNCHRSQQMAWENGAECAIPPQARNQIYVFMIHGITPSTSTGVETLREELGKNGFSKIACAEMVNALWVLREVKDIQKYDPQARFVFVGYDLGAPVAAQLARHLSARGVGVDAVVLLDPLGPMPPEGAGVHTLLITSGSTVSGALHSERVVVPDASHFGLPTHATTVTTIMTLLKGIATQQITPLIDPVPAWSYEHAPEMRPTALPVQAGTSDPWDFLSDRGGVPLPINVREDQHVHIVPQVPSTSADAVRLPR